MNPRPYRAAIAATLLAALLGLPSCTQKQSAPVGARPAQPAPSALASPALGRAATQPAASQPAATRPGGLPFAAEIEAFGVKAASRIGRFEIR